MLTSLFTQVFSWVKLAPNPWIISYLTCVNKRFYSGDFSHFLVSVDVCPMDQISKGGLNAFHGPFAPLSRTKHSIAFHENSNLWPEILYPEWKPCDPGRTRMNWRLTGVSQIQLQQQQLLLKPARLDQVERKAAQSEIIHWTSDLTIICVFQLFYLILKKSFHWIQRITLYLDSYDWIHYVVYTFHMYDLRWLHSFIHMYVQSEYKIQKLAKRRCLLNCREDTWC